MEVIDYTSNFSNLNQLIVDCVSYLSGLLSACIIAYSIRV